MFCEQSHIGMLNNPFQIMEVILFAKKIWKSITVYIYQRNFGCDVSVHCPPVHSLGGEAEGEGRNCLKIISLV